MININILINTQHMIKDGQQLYNVIYHNIFFNPSVLNTTKHYITFYRFRLEVRT